MWQHLVGDARRFDAVKWVVCPLALVSQPAKKTFHRSIAVGDSARCVALGIQAPYELSDVFGCQRRHVGRRTRAAAETTSASIASR